MENNIFLDKVVEFLVRDSKMDYDEVRLYTPFQFTHFFPHPFSPTPLFPLPSQLLSFSKYCNNVYGLTELEIEYVWNQYIDIIKDKIENGE